MSYAIGNLIYGVPWTEELNDLYNEMEHEGSDEFYNMSERFGFEQLYSGSAMIMPGYLGVKLAQFTECNDIKLSSLTNKQPTEKQIEDVKKMVNELPDRVKSILDDIDMYVIWSSS